MKRMILLAMVFMMLLVSTAGCWVPWHGDDRGGGHDRGRGPDRGGDNHRGGVHDGRR